jgi:hypothetical protein
MQIWAQLPFNRYMHIYSVNLLIHINQDNNRCRILDLDINIFFFILSCMCQPIQSKSLKYERDRQFTYILF